MAKNSEARSKMFYRPIFWPTPRKSAQTAVLCLSLLTIVILPAFASGEGRDGRGYIAIGGGFQTGDFGTSTRSNLSYLGPTLGYASPSWDLAVTAPYLFLSNPTTNQTSSANKVNGIGDVILRADKTLVLEGPAGFSLDVGLAVKLPTASSADVLGTGKTDYETFAGIHQRAGSFRLSAFGGYLKVGNPLGLDYHDTPLYGLGVSRSFGMTSVSIWFDERRSMMPGVASPQEVSADIFHVLNRKLALKGGTFFGLNKGGADFGLTGGIVCWF